jgi:hypothetical protein
MQDNFLEFDVERVLKLRVNNELEDTHVYHFIKWVIHSKINLQNGIPIKGKRTRQECNIESHLEGG